MTTLEFIYINFKGMKNKIFKDMFICSKTTEKVMINTNNKTFKNLDIRERIILESVDKFIDLGSVLFHFIFYMS